MTSLLSRLFSFLGGNGSTSAAVTASAETREAYKDVALIAHPIREGNQFRISGTVEKRDGETVMVRRYIRADVFTSEKEAVEFTLRKGRQIVDQYGPSLFADGAAEGRV